MKGTIQRGRHVAEDIHNKEQLINSSKDKNENKMIVNLMKEELLKIATQETIRILKLCVNRNISNGLSNEIDFKG